MATRKEARRAREVLDRRMREFGSSSKYTPPRLGWIRAVRDALGMSAADLASRMGVSGSSVRSLEEKELSGGIRLSSLQRAADAMDCTLVYAFVPRGSLSDTVEQQAARVYRQQSSRVNQTMALEAQEGKISSEGADAQIQAIIDSRALWSGGGVRR